jgi:hypothetical protein
MECGLRVSTATQRTGSGSGAGAGSKLAGQTDGLRVSPCVAAGVTRRRTDGRIGTRAGPVRYVVPRLKKGTRNADRT